MIKVSVFYPNTENGKFDIAYYCNSHMPMVKDKLGDACKGLAVDQAISGADPGSRPTHVAAGHLFFESVEAFRAAFGPHAKEIMADIPNYTNIQPIIEISNILINAARGQTNELHLHAVPASSS